MSARSQPEPRRRFTALILAGSRGAGDPVAAQAGVAHKALVPVGGIPMLERVVAALEASASVRRIVLQTNQPEIVDGLPTLREAVAAARIEVLPTAATPALSVSLAMDRLAGDLPLLVTTSDHALLRADIVDYFCGRAPAADIAVGLAAASTVLARYPGALRTFYRLGGERYSGCNLFALMTPRAKAAIDYWVALESHRKRPWRLVAAIGICPLVLYLLGRLDLRRAMAELSRIVGVHGEAVVLPFAEAPIDVDKPEDLALAERIVRERAAGGDPG